jgi:hypothetical protein
MPGSRRLSAGCWGLDKGQDQRQTDNRQQTTGNRQQTTDNRQQTTGNRQQTTRQKEQFTQTHTQTQQQMYNQHNKYKTNTAQGKC